MQIRRGVDGAPLGLGPEGRHLAQQLQQLLGRIAALEPGGDCREKLWNAKRSTGALSRQGGLIRIIGPRAGSRRKLSESP
jgi:hypothetical protein